MKNKLKIETITAFVSVDSDDNEGIMAFSHNNIMMPMVCADPERIKSMMEMAEIISQKSGKPYRVLRFSQRTDVTEETLSL